MSAVEQVREEITNLFNDLSHFKVESPEVHFAGSGKASIIKNAGAATITYCPNEVTLEISDGILKDVQRSGKKIDEVKIDDGRINFTGDITVEMHYKQPTYILSRDELFRAVSKYSHIIELKNARGKVTGRHEYWPKILDHYVQTRNFNVGPKNWLRGFQEKLLYLRVDRGLAQRGTDEDGWGTEFLESVNIPFIRRRTSVVHNDVDILKFAEAIDSAETVRSVYDNSLTQNYITVLKSIHPFSLDTPDTVNITGNNVRAYYSGDRSRFSAVCNGTQIMNPSKAVPSIRLPAVINSEHSDIPLIDANVKRSDGIPKSRETLIKSPVEIYIEDSNAIKVGRNRKKLSKFVAKSVAKYPYNVLSGALFGTALAELFSGVLYHGLVEVGSWVLGYPHPWLKTLVDIGISGMDPRNLYGQFNYGFWTFSSVASTLASISRMDKEVKNNGNMKLWLKGYEK